MDTGQVSTIVVQKYWGPMCKNHNISVNWIHCTALYSHVIELIDKLLFNIDYADYKLLDKNTPKIGFYQLSWVLLNNAY